MSVEGNVEEIKSLKALRGTITTVPQVDNTLTKRGYSADAKITGDAINERVKYRDIVDNMTTDDNKKVASARQVFLIGKQLATINLSEASTVGYSNADSGLNAQNMQGAIDELAEGFSGCVSKHGDSLIEGTIYVRTVDNGLGAFNKEHSDIEDLGTCITDKASDGRTAKVNISGESDALTYTGNNGETKVIIHEGKKPFGTYIGDGIKNERILDTKGVGRLMLVYNQDFFAFVTPDGAMITKISTGTNTWIDAEKVKYADGKLEMHTTHSAFNEVDIVYNYLVI